ENVLGNPGVIVPVGGKPVYRAQIRATTTDADFVTAANTTTFALGRPQPAAGVTSPYIPPQPPTGVASPTQGFFLLGPPVDNRNGDPEEFAFRDPFTAANSPTVPANTPRLRTPNLQYRVNFNRGDQTDERTFGTSVALRRLVNPHLPFNPTRTVPVKD